MIAKWLISLAACVATSKAQDFDFLVTNPKLKVERDMVCETHSDYQFQFYFDKEVKNNTLQIYAAVDFTDFFKANGLVIDAR